MKKIIFGIIAILSVFALVMSCSSGGSDPEPGPVTPPPPTTVTVTFHLEGGTLEGVTGDTFTKTVNKNAALGSQFPGRPEKEAASATLAYEFKNWYRNAEGTGAAVDAETTFSTDTDVYAVYDEYDPTSDAFVTFLLNNGTPDALCEPIKVAIGGTLGSSFPIPPTRGGYTFVGWATTADATTPDFTATTVIEGSISVYAIWEEEEEVIIPPLTLYPINEWKYTLLGDFTVENNATQKGWATNGTDDKDTDLTIGTLTGAQYLVLDMRNEPVGGVQFIWQGDGNEWAWTQTSITTDMGVPLADKGVTIDVIGNTVKFKIDLSQVADGYTNFLASTQIKFFIAYYSNNVADLGIERAYLVSYLPPPPGPDPEVESIVEEFFLTNGWFAIFQFTIPDGKTWNDYKHVKADYKLADATKEIRARVFGNYTQSAIDDVRLGQYTSTNGTFNVAVVDTWPSGDTGSWIMDNSWNGIAANSTTIQNAAYPEVKDDEWFTIFYPELGKNPHSQFNNGGISPEAATTSGQISDAYRYKVGRNPAILNTSGTYYLGLGFSVGNTDVGKEIRSQIMNVALYGDGVPDVVGVPLYIKKDGDLYRAFAGQLDGEKDEDTGLYPNFNSGRPEWSTKSGASLIEPVLYEEKEDITITYDLNYPNEDDPTDLAPEAVVFYPGSRFNSAQASVVPVPPTTPPVTPEGNSWVFVGWYTVPSATGGGKIVDRWQFDFDTTIYARWSSVAPVKITFNLNGGTGTKDPVFIEINNGRLSAEQLKPEGITAPTDKVFGGWYKTNPTLGTFNYKNIGDMVKTTEGFAVDTNVYAYWYTPGSTDVVIGQNEDDEDIIITVVAQGGGRIDEEGYVIFAADNENAWFSANKNDTLLTFAFPDNQMPTKANVKITYEFKWIVQPPKVGTPPNTNAGAATTWDDWVVDAAFIWKKAYGSWDSTTAGNYASFNTEGGTLSKPVSTLDSNATTKGIGLQINKGDDNNPGNNGGKCSKRAGGIYGIKITNIEFVD